MFANARLYNPDFPEAVIMVEREELDESGEVSMIEIYRVDRDGLKAFVDQNY